MPCTLLHLCIVWCRNGTRVGNQCCYKDGDLCTHKGCGGTVDKVSPRGDFKSCLDHYVQDIIPAIACTEPHKDDKRNQTYIDKRPIDNGTQFEPDPPPGRYYTSSHTGCTVLLYTTKWYSDLIGMCTRAIYKVYPIHNNIYILKY